jgi:hypothetical protein
LWRWVQSKCELVFDSQEVVTMKAEKDTLSEEIDVTALRGEQAQEREERGRRERA